jgi:RND family efflux transporter MFP subunit
MWKRVVLLALVGVLLAIIALGRSSIAPAARGLKAWFLNEKTEVAVTPGHDNHGGQARKVAYWYDSMNREFRSDKPGKAPDGMDLVPMYEDQLQAISQMPPGSTMLSPEKQQLIGVRTAPVEVSGLSRTLRTVGRIEADETKIARIHTKFQGWIDKVYVDFIGKLVRKGQPLFTIYSPELLATQQEYLIALKSQKLLANPTYRGLIGNENGLVDSARQRLKLWDISDDQIERLAKTNETTRTMLLSSPIDGYVTTREAYDNTFVTPEKELYTIVDLSSVWVNVDIYEYEAPFVVLGQKARMNLSYAAGKTYRGSVSYIYPTLDPNSRTLKVRLEFPNPNLELKPNMYADVELQIGMGTALQVPAEAVLDSGTRKVVFVVKDAGYFEPREIQVGAKVDAKFIVMAGLQRGEVIVTSGNFLLDSESRLSSASSRPAGPTVK